MKVEKDAAVSLQVQIVEGGNPSPAQEMTYLHGNGNLFAKMEAALEGLEPGGKTSVTLAPADGFGERDPARVRVEPRARLPDGAAVGMAVHGEPNADGQRPVFRITALTETEATLDANHPFAGRTVELRMTVTDVREATEEEIAHGHVHTPGHDHSH
jgi:FKBP-type peptidyl-prolyl cis-trans isomerase SlyD